MLRGGRNALTAVGPKNAVIGPRHGATSGRWALRAGSTNAKRPRCLLGALTSHTRCQTNVHRAMGVDFTPDFKNKSTTYIGGIPARITFVKAEITRAAHYTDTAWSDSPVEVEMPRRLLARKTSSVGPNAGRHLVVRPFLLVRPMPSICGAP